jgi:hypothetical protein
MADQGKAHGDSRERVAYDLMALVTHVDAAKPRTLEDWLVLYNQCLRIVAGADPQEVMKTKPRG